MLPLGSVYHNSKILYNFSLTLLVDREISGGGSVNRNREKTVIFAVKRSSFLISQSSSSDIILMNRLGGGWGCAAGTLEPLPYTRASQVSFATLC